MFFVWLPNKLFCFKQFHFKSNTFRSFIYIYTSAWSTYTVEHKMQRDTSGPYVLVPTLLHKLGLSHKLGLLVKARRRGIMVSRIEMMHEVVMKWLCTLLVIV